MKWFGMDRCMLVGIALVVCSGVSSAAEEVRVGGGYQIPLLKGKPYLHVLHDGRSIKVQRIQDPNYELKGYFAKTARKCPPFCIQPMRADPRVETIAEPEIFAYMEGEIRDGTALLVDARTPSWHRKGTIPGAISYPFTTLSKEPDSPEIEEAFEKFGAVLRGDVGFLTGISEKWGLGDTSLKSEKWDFTNAKTLVLWCNGPACGQSPRAIRGLLKAGYPPQKIRYYRGGMQLWQLWGLTTVTPN